MVASSPDMIAPVSGDVVVERAGEAAGGVRRGGVYGCCRSVYLGRGIFPLHVAGFLQLQMHRGQLGKKRFVEVVS